MKWKLLFRLSLFPRHSVWCVVGLFFFSSFFVGSFVNTTPRYFNRHQPFALPVTRACTFRPAMVGGCVDFPLYPLTFGRFSLVRDKLFPYAICLGRLLVSMV